MLHPHKKRAVRAATSEQLCMPKLFHARCSKLCAILIQQKIRPQCPAAGGFLYANRPIAGGNMRIHSVSLQHKNTRLCAHQKQNYLRMVSPLCFVCLYDSMVCFARQALAGLTLSSFMNLRISFY